MSAKRILVSFPLLAVLCAGQDTQTPPAAEGPSRGGAPPSRGEAEIKPYDKVITKDAKSQQGLFGVHNVKGKYYFEIPAAQLAKDMLLVVSFKNSANGLGYGGTEIANEVVRWERRDKRVLLRQISYDVMAKDGDPIAKAVRASNEQTIVMAFNIEALGKDEAPVIDVTRMFTSDVSEFSARRRLGARGFDSARTFVDKIRAFPININAEATHTYTASDSGPGAAGPGTPGGAPTGMRPGANATVVVSYSMIKLPDNPMKARVHDDRVGYFSLGKLGFMSETGRAEQFRLVKRWRLEKKDPSAAMSEPVKPIEFYVDPATPAQWIPYVKKGIEDWQPAFESAGFRKAIVAREVPVDDPDFSLEDARYSSVRWLASSIMNAYGPSVADPRTGEILEADIKMYHNVLLLQRNWYFSQVGHLDKRAQKFPMPDALMGELIRYVVVHEVGHSLGLQHNMKASGMYSLAQVRDRNWVRKNGHTPTLMDYSRFNYVAQPEDGIPVEDLIPKIGPYDHYSIKWGYTTIPNAATPEAEKPVLDEWLKAQEKTPWLRFSTPGGTGVDPTDQTEAVGDADAVAATALGTKNIKRVLELLPGAFPADGDSFEDLGDLYEVVLRQWRTELGHVTPIVGGMESHNKHQGQAGVVFTPVPRERQKAAVRFLSDNVFATPMWAVRPEIVAKVSPQGAMVEIGAIQRAVLDRLLTPLKLERMMEMEALHGAKAYAPAELLADLRAGIFGELTGGAAKVEPFRRNLQRSYVSMVGDLLNRPQSGAAPQGRIGNERQPKFGGNNDTRALLRAELRTIAAAAKTREGAAADAVTRAHLEDLRDQIEKALDPKLAPTPSLSTGTASRRSIDEPGCWFDYRSLEQ